jgi:methylphosphotriester-DNA--protein-cysteine methyltransferase
VRNHQHKTWITCALSFRDRRVVQWAPNHDTPLFFLDEAVALAAGHRPCAECRRGSHAPKRAAQLGPRKCN